jgi:acetyltransferase
MENQGMQGLARKFGFTISTDPEDSQLVNMVLELNP